jgi:hypothetical protein
MPTIEGEGSKGQSEGGWEGQTRYVVSAPAASPTPTITAINSFARMLVSSLPGIADFRLTIDD